jgi:hypothetical protein
MSTNFEDLIGRGVTGSKPAAGIPGRLYYDTTLERWERDTGVAWEVCEPPAGGGDAGDITYTPTVLTDWDGDADPGNVDDALDQLAERVDDLEGAGGSAYTQGARVYNNANISVADASGTALTFNSERYDTDTIHDTVTNPERLTCKTAGKYIITGHVFWASDNDGYRQLEILVNATTIAVTRNLAVTGGNAQSITTIYDLEVNDYVTLKVYHTAGNALNVTAAGNYSPEFAMQRIG